MILDLIANSLLSQSGDERPFPNGRRTPYAPAKLGRLARPTMLQTSEPGGWRTIEVYFRGADAGEAVQPDRRRIMRRRNL